MKKNIILALLLALPVFALAEGDDEVGVWTEIGIDKTLSPHWSVGLDAEFRCQNKERASIGANVGYKLNKYLKFGASYSFLCTHKPDKMSKMEYDDDVLVSYRLTENYWSPRHRATVGAVGDIKLFGWLHISLRERYQFTHRPEQTITRTDVETNEYFTPEGMVTETEYTNTAKKVKSFDDHVLRSRLKFAYEKKKVKLSPFISAEAHNSLTAGNHMVLEKVRTSIGTTYKFKKKHEITWAYVLTFDIHDDDDDLTRIHDRMHAINIGYNYKF